MKGNLKGLPIVAAALWVLSLLVVSMGFGSGWKVFLRAAKYAAKWGKFLWYVFSTSGGARMQEALMSLFSNGQKQALVLGRMREHGFAVLFPC